jgi:hypothetical protein
VDIIFLLGFGRVMQYPYKFQKICSKAQRISKIHKEVNGRALSSFDHEEYPTDSLNQNNLAHGVHKIPE